MIESQKVDNSTLSVYLFKNQLQNIMKTKVETMVTDMK